MGTAFGREKEVAAMHEEEEKRLAEVRVRVSDRVRVGLWRRSGLRRFGLGLAIGLGLVC